MTDVFARSRWKKLNKDTDDLSRERWLLGAAFHQL